ncbi:MAG: LPXTG cell wall anchor domain-containing protein, partial [Clostridia bacterium]|nr:LPXTG cell wall anchor domain-containing protein [Clostridia bacterium]
DGTLTVTCYDPWRPDLWLAKYTYTGTVTGNSINASADQFVLSEVNPAAADASWSVNWLSTFSTYNVFYANIAGGNHIFNYTLEVKDEYKQSTEYSKYILRNTAEIVWDAGGTSGPATEKTEYKTGLVDKQVVQENNKLNFSIHINEYCLDILDGLDMITFEDTMTENLSVYWNTIKLYYEDENGNWIDFDSTNKYNYTVTYDQLTNTLKFVVPDELHIKIDYTTLITQSGLVSVSNSVVITGSAQVSDVVDATFKVQDHSGGATGSMHDITLLKQDGLTKAPLPSATFLLYGPMGDPDAVLPDGASETVVAKGGKTLRYIGKYTTGDDGTVNIATQYLTMGGPYALVEMVAPAGYELLTEPTYFYFYEEDPDGVIQSVTTLIAVENFNDSFLFPETGGNGTVSLTIIGLTLMVAPLLYSILRFKRERRFARRSP